MAETDKRILWGTTRVEPTDRKHPRVFLKWKQSGAGAQIISTEIRHPDGTDGGDDLMRLMGLNDPDVFNLVLQHAIMVTTHGMGKAVDQDRVNFIMSVIRSIQPKDALEAMLAAQMAGIHLATSNYGALMAFNASAALPERDHAERTLNKLTRTFATQMEALKRYRSTAAQRVEVHHHHHHHHQNVNVQEGGQAVVANGPVALAGGESKTGGLPHAVTNSPGEAMPGKVQAIRPAVSLASC